MTLAILFVWWCRWPDRVQFREERAAARRERARVFAEVLPARRIGSRPPAGRSIWEPPGASFREQGKFGEALKRPVSAGARDPGETGSSSPMGVLQFTLIAFIRYSFYREARRWWQPCALPDRVAGNFTERLLGIIVGTITGVVYGIVGPARAGCSRRGRILVARVRGRHVGLRSSSSCPSSRRRR